MLKNVQEVAEKFNTVDLLNVELKRIASIKCRFKTQKMRRDYEEKMTEILQYEQTLKEAKSYLQPIKKFVTNYSIDDVNELDYDETIKSMKSIQSKKCFRFSSESK